MEQLMTWLKGILILFVAGNLLIYLVQGKTYEKYIRFFFQMVLLFAVIAPAASLLQSRDNFFDRISFYEWKQELENERVDILQFQTEYDDDYRAKCEELLENEIRSFLKLHGWEVTKIQAVLTEDYSIEEVLVETEKEEEKQELFRLLQEQYQLTEGQIRLLVTK
ncbi:MAG: stage III sporulation protein AF [Lachnospiraceae bacterium]|nr:stage III sporulation protein AF [Lachnospiraceae bacterium]